MLIWGAVLQGREEGQSNAGARRFLKNIEWHELNVSEHKL